MHTDLVDLFYTPLLPTCRAFVVMHEQKDLQHRHRRRNQTQRMIDGQYDSPCKPESFKRLSNSYTEEDR